MGVQIVGLPFLDEELLVASEVIDRVINGPSIKSYGENSIH